jgi:hypothetical protein
MRTSLPVRVERLWWVRRLRRLLRSLGTLPLVLDASVVNRHSLGLACEFRTSDAAGRVARFVARLVLAFLKAVLSK